jgi:hypothetical protein
MRTRALPPPLAHTTTTTTTNGRSTMPGKYQIEAVLTLATELEPEGRIGGVEDSVSFYEETSSWDTAHFTCEGGIVNFVVEANSEDEARDLALSALSNAYFSEYGDITWEIEDYSISNIECIQEPMDMSRAKDIILEWLNRDSEALSTPLREALRFVVEELLNP